MRASVVMLLHATRFGSRDSLEIDESRPKSGRNETTYPTSVLDYAFPPISTHVQSLLVVKKDLSVQHDFTSRTRTWCVAHTE